MALTVDCAAAGFWSVISTAKAAAPDLLIGRIRMSRFRLTVNSRRWRSMSVPLAATPGAPATRITAVETYRLGRLLATMPAASAPPTAKPATIFQKLMPVICVEEESTSRDIRQVAGARSYILQERLELLGIARPR